MGFEVNSMVRHCTSRQFKPKYLFPNTTFVRSKGEVGSVSLIVVVRSTNGMKAVLVQRATKLDFFVGM